jgi:glycerol-3-phosphate acyltransferase PlsY
MGSFIATTPGAISACYYVYTRYIAVQSITIAKFLVAGISNLFIVLIIILTWYAHRKNIERLIAGEEHPTNWLQMIRESIIKKRLKKERKEEEQK